MERKLTQAMDDFINGLAGAMQAQGDIICEQMKSTIANKPQHANDNGEPYYERTGRLIESIKSQTEADGNVVTTYIIADAKDPSGQYDYAEFLEYGTGKYNTSKTGRNTPWIYRDYWGNYHKTEGMKPYPFIEPAVMDAFDALDSLFADVDADIRKYKR